MGCEWDAAASLTDPALSEQGREAGQATANDAISRPEGRISFARTREAVMLISKGRVAAGRTSPD